MRVLFLCSGNAARSQIAEVCFNAWKKSSTARAQSAGTLAIIHKPIPTQVLKNIDEEGLSADGLFRKLVTPELVSQSDMVISFLPEEDIPKFVNRDMIVHWNIPDPRYEDASFHRSVFDAIKIRVKDYLKEHDL